MNRSTRRFRIAALAMAMLTLVSCASLQQDKAYEAVPGAETQKLGSLELELALLRTVPDQKALSAIRSRLQELAKDPNTDPLYRARLFALASEAALLAGNAKEAQRRLYESKAAYEGDEIALLAESMLEGDPAKKMAILDAGIAKADVGDRLKAEKANLLLEAGAYREALALFDSVLPRLPAEYAALYAPSRDKAYALRSSDGKVKESSQAYLAPTPLPLLGMVVIAQEESGLLDWFTGGASWSPGVLFERLKSAGWFADQGAKAEAQATRKDAAVFVWQLLSRGKSAMLRKYSVRYASSATSPVPDVAYGSPWFDAALGLVEEGIMNLPDGRNFRPEEIVTGLDFYATLSAAARYK